MADKITLNVPQGIGDIFWVYQKLSPFFDTINFNIILTDTPDAIQTRSRDWLSLLPKCGNVNFLYGGPEWYDRMIAHPHTTEGILAAYNNGERTLDCSFNKNLEEGQRLEAIDPNLPVEWKINISSEPFVLPFIDYIMLYVCGSNKSLEVWSLETWVNVVKAFYAKYQINHPIVIIGASYDSEILLALQEELKKQEFTTKLFIDLKPARVIHLFKNSHFYIGYQSGLSIIADNCGTPQLMAYFQKLEPMMYTWCRPEHLGNGKYTAVLFSDGVEKVITTLPAVLPPNEGRM